MLSLGHYDFKLRIKCYAKKYGKHVIDCNESYTSKIRSWDGTIDDKKDKILNLSFFFYKSS